MLSNPKEVIEWFDPSVHEPDDDRTVMLFVPEASEPVWPGFQCDEVWYWASGSPVNMPVVAWSHLPIGPKVKSKRLQGASN